jgi:hypothetical protein
VSLPPATPTLSDETGTSDSRRAARAREAGIQLVRTSPCVSLAGSPGVALNCCLERDIQISPLRGSTRTALPMDAEVKHGSAVFAV